MKSASVIADGKVESVTLIFEMDGDGRGLGMANSVRYSLLTDADKVMDAAGSERNFFSFDLERCSDHFLHVIGRERAGQRLRKDVRNLLGVAQIPDNAASLGLTVRNHASSQLAGLGRRSGRRVTVAEELGGGLE